MPLLFILDNELGIGYAGNSSGDINPLVDDLVLPRGATNSNISQSFIQSVLLQRYRQSSQEVIELTDEDVKGVEAVWDDLPPTFSVMCQILQDNELGRLFYIKSAGGPGAANLLGRFCHLDEQILNHTLAITEKESETNPDVIFAEIVHLPESRIGNILLRPVLRPYEIPYLAKSGVAGEFEFRPDDLYVSIKSVVKKRTSFQLEEFLFNPGTAVVQGPEGVFTNEFVFAFYRESPTKIVSTTLRK